MDPILTYGVVAFRVLTIFLTLQLVTMAMGKRQIAELPVFDFVVAITLGAVAGADLADHTIPHGPTIFAIAVVGLVQVVVTRSKVVFDRFRSASTFEPTIIIYRGKLIKENLARIRYSIDDVLAQLRSKDVFDLNKVEYAVVEENGEIGVKRYPLEEPPTRLDLNVPPEPTRLPRLVIADGSIRDEALESLNVTRDDLQRQLADAAINDLSVIYVAMWDGAESLYYSRVDEQGPKGQFL